MPTALLFLGLACFLIAVIKDSAAETPVSKAPSDTKPGLDSASCGERKKGRADT
jgi:hypothetical protein